MNWVDLISWALVLLIVVPIAYAGVSGAPFVMTKKKAAIRMIEEARLKIGDKAVDLGAGMGLFPLLARKRFGREVSGIELVPVYLLAGKLILALNGVRPSLLRYGNFYKMDFAGIDVFFAYLMPETLQALKEKFLKEGKKGAKIVSYAFEIKGWQPEKIVKEQGSAPIFIYRI